ncbi:DNA-binding protein [Chryseobacterium sp. T16E-39]|uniref:Crp/Fnr family transcriptional regulator n=1 Tax=Chryseobacterium sp. T16E-39 TaxID=2015076 RepID=UPI000B5B3DEA|nr:Crp/Fnr family transcriptional regulator [Chryseobacterium sp. T16E-39]ASK32290.1 DNA-binding protein [Chryseobacterium sp. T16E-39]
MELSKYLQGKLDLMPTTISFLDSQFDHKELQKNHILLSSGNHSKEVFFIEKGLIRSFYYKDGKDITDFFYKEDTFLFSIKNIFLNQTDSYNYELLENCKIRSIHYSAFEKLLDQFPKLNYSMRIYMARNIKFLSERVYDIQFQSAEYRYRKLIEASPDIVLRAALGDIASYLGITQQTLSVIRAGIFSKKK